MSEMTLNKKRLLLGRFVDEYVEGNTVMIHDKKAFAQAATEAFEALGDNPTYEEFEANMRKYPSV